MKADGYAIHDHETGEWWFRRKGWSKIGPIFATKTAAKLSWAAENGKWDDSQDRYELAEVVLCFLEDIKQLSPG